MANQLPPNGYLLGLDVGEKRIGTALASSVARLPQPAPPIAAGNEAYDAIKQMIADQQVSLVVVGLPRNMQGEETAQSATIRQFTEGLRQKVAVAVVFADESLSSVRADELIRDNTFSNASRDSLAACFILEEYIRLAEIENKGDV